MVNIYLVNMLVRKIKTKEINPNTGEPFCLEDIKIDEYKQEVEKQLEEVINNGANKKD